MARIEKKIWPVYFNEVESGEKRYEIRVADFDAQVGDTLVLREWDPKTKQYTGRQLEKTISRVFNTKDDTFFPKDEVEKYGLYVLGIK